MLTILVMAAAVGGASGGGAGGAGGAAVVAPAASLATVVEIDKRCDAAEKVGARKPERVFGEASEKWREFRDPAELKRVVKTMDVNTQGFVWSLPDGVRYVQVFFTSPTGDWGQFADLCFRADGTLARATDTVDNFAAADVADESDDAPGASSREMQTTHYAPDGRRLRRTSRLSGQQAGKPPKAKRVHLIVDKTYLRIADLPFAGLLSQPKDSKPLVAPSAPPPATPVPPGR